MDAERPCPFDIDRVLGSDPFAGDYGDGERVLSDKIVRARKYFHCHQCEETHAAGEWARARVEVSEEGIKTYRWCEPCCIADDLSDWDGGAAQAAREAIGYAIREGRPQNDIIKCKATWSDVLEKSRQLREEAASDA